MTKQITHYQINESDDDGIKELCIECLQNKVCNLFKSNRTISMKYISCLDFEDCVPGNIKCTHYEVDEDIEIVDDRKGIDIKGKDIKVRALECPEVTD